MNKHCTTQEDDVTCPHCGYKFQESYEYADNDGDTIQCGSCEKNFVLEVHRSLSFSTTKVNCENKTPPHVHQWNEEMDLNVTTTEDVERYKRENSCLRDTKEGQFWIRTCDACGHEEFSKKVPPGGPCVFKDDVSYAETVEAR